MNANPAVTGLSPLSHDREGRPEGGVGVGWIGADGLHRLRERFGAGEFPVVFTEERRDEFLGGEFPDGPVGDEE